MSSRSLSNPTPYPFSQSLGLGALFLSALTAGCSSSHLTPSSEISPLWMPALPALTIEESLVQRFDGVLALTREQDIIARRLGMPSIIESFRESERPFLIGEIVSFKDRFAQLASQPASVENLTEAWEYFGLLCTAADKHCREVRVGLKASIELSRLAQNYTLRDELTAELQVLDSVQQKISRTAVETERTLKDRGVNTSPVIVRVDSGKVASPEMVRDWRVCLSAALRASQMLSVDLMVFPGSTVGDVRTGFIEALKAEEAGSGSQALGATVKQIFYAKTLVRLVESTMVDDIAAASVVKKEVEQLEPNQRTVEMDIAVESGLEKSVVRWRLFFTDTEEARALFEKAEKPRSQEKQKAERLDDGGAQIKFYR